MSESDSRAISLAWYYKEQFGFSKAPPQSDPEVVQNMALALVAAASGDGSLSEAERSWIIGYFATKGYPDAVLEQVRDLSDPQSIRIEELMQLGMLKKSGRILIYDAIRASSADEYTAGERDAVRRVAAALGIEAATVGELEALVEEERALKEKRVKLLMPGGHPNL